MIIFELIKPGFRIELDNKNKAYDIELLINQLIEIFYEANLALNLFDEEDHSRKRSLETKMEKSKEKFIQRNKERAKIKETIEQEYHKKSMYVFDHIDEINLRTEIELNRLAWMRGEKPRQFCHNLLFLYAKSFLYALDNFDRLLEVLAKEDGVPETLVETHNKIKEYFPSLRGVRNSAHHMEDRLRGLKQVDQSGKKHVLKLKPIKNAMINAEQGALVLNNLRGSNYGTIMATGHFGEVDVSAQSLEKLHAILKEVINSFNWNGRPEVLPSREM